MQAPAAACAELVELIYEGPLEANPWQAFLEGLRHVTNATRASIQLHRAPNAEQDVRVAATHSENAFDWQQCLELYRQKYIEFDPIRHHTLASGSIVTIEDCAGTRFHREFLQPNEIVHLVRTSVTEPNGMRCWLQLYGRRSLGPFDVDRDVRLLQTLLPHLGRALRLYARMMLNESEKLSYQAAISHLAFGSLVLDGEGKIIDSNAVAQQLIQRHRSISVSAGVLELEDAASSQELKAAIFEAISLRKCQSDEPYVDLVRMKCKCGAILAFLVVLPPLMRYFQGERTPNVIVYMCDLEARLDDDQDRQLSREHLVAKLLKLTQSEARLAMLLADGLTLADAAVQMNVTESTARSYSKRIFEKTGINRQTDLVRLIYRSVALLG